MQPGRTLAPHTSSDPTYIKKKIASKVGLRILMDPIGMMYVSPKRWKLNTKLRHFSKQWGKGDRLQ